MIYLDNAATTKVSDEVLEAMLPYFKEQYGNPNSKYYYLAVNAKNAVESARKNVADYFGVEPDEVIFNSGASEGNNTVIKGVAFAHQHKGKHLITTAVEHSSVYQTMKYLETKGFEVTYLRVDRFCQISLEELKQAIRKDTILVSIMWVNNDVGSIFPIKEIADICEQNKVFFHTDATQAIGKIDTRIGEMKGVSFLTFSGHKIHAPKGIGALIIRKDELGITLKIDSLIHGGEQEFGLRGGTLNVPYIVGLATAVLNISKHNLSKIIDNERILIKSIIEKNGEIINSSENFNKVPGIICVRFRGINNGVLLKNTSTIWAASTGSACSNTSPSRTLIAMGLSSMVISETIRISLAYDTVLEINSLSSL